MSFGTGAVKITPAHDPNDFASGQRHKLDSINLYTDDGCINDNGGKFAGQPRFQVTSLPECTISYSNLMGDQLFQWG